jgi:NAD(P)-dependent dehydrogenase (short-subunit alcohol dehydrogenase family)
MDLEGQTAIITGGGSGIGRAISRRLSRDGASVVLADVDRDGAEGTANDIVDQGGDAIAIETDVSDSDDVDVLLDRTLDHFGRLDVLVNNAGIITRGPVTETSDGDWDDVVDVNLGGPFRCSRRAVPAMDGDGVIVNVASVAGLVGRPNRSAYCASKGGVVNLTRQLSTELAGEGIRVNGVAPGMIATGMLADRLGPDETTREELAAEIPADRLGDPEDVAAVVSFLCSDEAAYVSGVTIPVDGGWVNGRLRRE